MAQHISIRIPWKDNGYEGDVCNKPCYNTSCLRLKNIAKNRDDSLEEKLAGCPMAGHEMDIPCLSEGGCFMSDKTYRTIEVHPYKNRPSCKKTHSHFLETELVYPPFSLPATPFGWMLRSKTSSKDSENISRLMNKYGIDYKAEYEPDLSFDTYWVQDARNHRAILNSFFSNVIPNQSLVVLYAKQVPFIDDNKRIIMGIGFVTSKLEPPEHRHTNEGDLRSMLWETMVGHSIRNDRVNGFLLPYREMMEYAKGNPNFDMESVAVFADDEYFDEFSYAAEHLSYDAVISVLLQMLKSLSIIKECIPGNWNECIRWIKERLRDVWQERGLFPGLGSMLHALGFQSYNLIASEIKKVLNDESDFERQCEDIILHPHKYLPESVVSKFDRSRIKLYKTLGDDRKKLFWLMARMNLSERQAFSLFNNERRIAIGIRLTDNEIINNPYVLYEKTRLLDSNYCVSVKTVDMAVFPSVIVRDINPLSEPSSLDSANDERRVRAYVVSRLEMCAQNGHTVYPRDFIINQLNDLSIDPALSVTSDLLNSIENFVSGEVSIDIDDDNNKYYQLRRLTEFDDVIRQSIRNRLEAKRHVVNENWGHFIDEEFSRKKVPDFQEKNIAREERVAILKELAESRVSVLIGGAGTGKTTLLALLCKSKQISNGGVLLLAPTGKARVRISQAMKEHRVVCQAKTVAQFLGESDRYDGYLGRYKLSNKEAMNVSGTVVVDESSMLTEEMFGALLQALRKHAQRIIFVGDPNQLPPIGAGRPFVDLVEKLRPENNKIPNVAQGFGELTINMRQLADKNETREDTELAKWFTNDPSDLDDDIFIRLQSGDLGNRVAFKKWNTPEDLEKTIIKVVSDETCMKDENDIEGFNKSLGGVKTGEWMNFGSRPEMVEDWQILSPYKNDAGIGTGTVNRYIHDRYRFRETKQLYDCKIRKTIYLLGTDGIVYGDKVINIRNQKKKAISKNIGEDYVANGEVGIVENLWHDKWPYKHQIKFSSQPNSAYTWISSVSDEGNSDIELAYALTVHKSQGSEFGKAILILNEPSRMLSRELLYTAITRQKNKLIILYNSDATKLRDYASPFHSEIAKRLTCLFKKPELANVDNIYFEKSLIHMTLKGHLVRSKSEVIIANMLYEAGIDYEYEKELQLEADGRLLPDFTIEDAERGICFYWEHCGMLGDYSYRKRWEEKKVLYSKHGIVEGDNLIVSKDSHNGGIDSIELKRIISRLKEALSIQYEETMETYYNEEDDCSLNGSYDLNEELIPKELQNNAIDLPVTGELKGWFYLVCYEGRLQDYTDKATDSMCVPVFVNGREKRITVSVVREDRIIYIQQYLFDLFEDELSDPDGINIIWD